MMSLGLQELLLLMLVIAILSVTGLWPLIIKGLRELRGDGGDGGDRAPASGSLDVCYRIMGVSASAPWEEIERAYRRKAKRHHPDHGGDEDAMRALNEAYAMLKKDRGK